jgi:tRNA/rRNA methyltransferase
MMACSAAWSTSVTKSLGPLLPIFSRSRSSAARLMMAPAARAALTAMLSMGCRDCDMDGITCACATAMTPRDFGPPTVAPRAGLAGLAGQGRTVAFVFGPERVGLANEDVYRCHVCLSIPTAPDYGSLNLGQAVQILAYEWRQALGGFDVRSRVEREPRADSRSLLGLLEHWRQTLERIGFLDPTAPRKLMPRLTRLILRARPTAAEVHILRGIARAVVAPDHAAMFSRLREDIACIRERDPAARSTWEVLTCYPGLHALMLHRWAHAFWRGAGAGWAGSLSHIGALPHRHRDPPRRHHRPARVHRPRHGRGDRRDGRDRRRLHHLPGRDAGRHLADARAPSATPRWAAA